MKRFLKIGGWFIALSILALVCGCGGGGGGGSSEPTPTPTPTPTPSPNAQLSGDYFATSYAERTTTLPANIQTKTITVDGNTADWAGINPLITDGAGNQWKGAGAVSGSDVIGVYLAKGSTDLFFRIDLGDGVPNTSVRYRIYMSNNPNFPYPYLYLHCVYSGSQWLTYLYSWDGQNADLKNAVGVPAFAGASSIEMSLPITLFTAFGWTLDRWYIEGGTKSPTVNNANYNYDITDILEARFVDTPPDASWKECGFATFTFDGQGGYTFSGSGASNAEGANYPTSGSGTYTVNSDGTVTMSGSVSGAWKFGLQKGAKMLVGGVINDPDNSQGIALLYKKGGTHFLGDSNLYSTSYNKGNNSQSSNLSTVDTTAQGIITSDGKNNSNTSLAITDFSIAGTYTRNTEGSNVTTFPSTWSAGTIGPAPGTPKYIPYVYPGGSRDDELFSSTVELNNQNRGRQRMSANIKRPTAAQSNASLVGDFFLAGYVDKGGVRSSLFGTITFDGAGAYSMTGTSSTSDKGVNQPSSDSGTYSYEPAAGFFPTGTFVIKSNSNPTQETLVLNDEGDIALVTNMADTSYQGMGVMVKIK